MQSNSDLNNLLLPEQLILHTFISVVLKITEITNVVSNRAINTDFVSPCNHEEADTHMFIPAKHATLGGIRSITLVMSDTYVKCVFF